MNNVTKIKEKEKEKEPEKVIMSNYGKELLKNLYLIRCYSGFEEPIRRAISSFLDSLKIPYINFNGNILGFNHPGAPLFSAHMDMVNTESYKLKAGEIKIEDYTFTLDDKACLRLYRGTQKEGKRTSLGADDKNGIWTILMLLKEGKKINFAFCHSEETGGTGSSQVVNDSELAKFVQTCPFGIIIDRRNAHDIIGYDNKYCLTLDDKLEQFSETRGYKFKTARGSISDADRFSRLIECVNLSCGYYEPHTSKEYTNLNELWNTYLFCKDIVDHFEFSPVSSKRIKEFKGVGSTTTTYPRSSYGYGYGYGYREEQDDYDSYYGYNRNNVSTNKSKYTNYASSRNSDTTNSNKNNLITVDPQKKRTKKEEAPIETTKNGDDIFEADTDIAITDNSYKVLLKIYKEEMEDLGVVYSTELDAYIAPLYSEEKLPEDTLPAEVIHYFTCPNCGKSIMLLQDSMDALLLDYYAGGEFFKILGACMDCGSMQRIDSDLKPLF